MLDELRRGGDEEEFDFDQDIGRELADDGPARDEPRFLGMTAVERMFLSIFFFMNVFILGLAILLATQRIQF